MEGSSLFYFKNYFRPNKGIVVGGGKNKRIIISDLKNRPLQKWKGPFALENMQNAAIPLKKQLKLSPKCLVFFFLNPSVRKKEKYDSCCSIYNGN